MERYFDRDGVRIPISLLEFLSSKEISSPEEAEQVYEEMDEDLLNLLWNMELPLLEVLEEMQRVGVQVDREKLASLGEELAEELERIEQEIEGLVGERINLNSPRQVGFLLYEKLGLPVLKRGKSGPSTNEAVLRKLVPMHPVVEKILEYRELNKILSSYVNPLLSAVDESGKIYAKFSLTNTQTGRITAIEPNLQTIPIRGKWGKRIREAFISRYPGGFILSADYSQIELRVLAHISEDRSLISAFLSDEDVHTLTARKIFGKEEISESERDLAKRVNFGIIYGMSAQGLADQLGIDRASAQRFIDAYFRAYPGVKKFIDQTIRQARARGWVRTIWGHRRYIPQLFSRNKFERMFGERAAINTVVQGSAAEVIKWAMLKVASRLKGKKSLMVLQVHDELVFDVPAEELDWVRGMIKEEMEQAVRLNVPLKVDVHWGRNYLEAKG